MSRYFNKKAPCAQGHTHDSKREAARCGELHALQSGGQIIGLKVAPCFHFMVAGEYLKARNGHKIRYTGDFTYIEGNRQIVEDVKAKNLHLSRDVPIKLALMARCYPDIDLRLVV